MQEDQQAVTNEQAMESAWPFVHQAGRVMQADRGRNVVL
jgi:hypothetical protein